MSESNQNRQGITRKGKRFVPIKERELRRLERLAASVKAAESADKLPAWPKADVQGRRPALAFARASIARSIVEERRAAGLSQEELARLAGLRQETVCRIESGKHSPTVRTVAKIDKALQAALAKGGKPARRRKGK
jgi:ribosome-binding protein aMBF1 (putative translation factor)